MEDNKKTAPNSPTTQPTTQTDTIIIRYAEIGLKGKNRSDFENRLIDSIRHNLESSNIGFTKIRRLFGRILISTDDRSGSLKRVFGISSFSYAIKTEQDIEAIMQRSLEIAELSGIGKDTSFKVDVQRVDKSFPMKSIELAAAVGEHIINRTHAPVKMKKPDIMLNIELIDGKAYIFTDRTTVAGYGGLPLGQDSRVAVLMSSGIDSPVASFMMMKRGCSCTFIFNDNTPFAPEGEKANVIEQFNNLKRYDPKAALYIVPFGKIQQKVGGVVRDRFRCIFCKQLMYLVAEEIAKKEGIKAIVTGESIGQVASQTLDNLSVLDSIAEMPILRPLIGMNKQEIIDIARDIGTYKTSTLTKGCCGFLPSNPATKAKKEMIDKEHLHLESKIGDIRRLISDTIEEAEIIK